MRVLSLFLVLALTGCSSSDNGGTPMLGGDVNGTMGEISFRPGYGIAYEDANGFRVQLSEAPINCSEYLGADKSAGAGMYSRITLPNAATGTYDNAGAENAQIVSENHLTFVKRSIFSTGAKVVLTTVNAERVEGTITHASKSGETAWSLNGSFQVTRCAK